MMLLVLVGLVFLVLGASKSFPVIKDVHYEAKNIYLPDHITLPQVMQEISHLKETVSSVMLWYMMTKGRDHALDPFDLSSNPQGTKGAQFWLAIRHRLDAISTENDITMESLYTLSYIITINGLLYDGPVYRKGHIVGFKRKKIPFRDCLDLTVLDPSRSKAETLRQAVSDLLEKMKDVRISDDFSIPEAKFRARLYFKALKLLHYASILFPIDNMDMLKVELIFACHSVVTRGYDPSKPFDAFFIPYISSLRSIHEILMNGILDIHDSDHLLGELLHNGKWADHLEDSLVKNIEEAYVTPYLVASEAKLNLALRNAQKLMEMEEVQSNRKGLRVLKEEARERKVMESASEDEEIPAQESAPEINLQQWTFSDLTEPLAFTIKVILAQHYRLNFLLPIWDSLDGNTGEEGSDFSWDAFVRDPQVHQKAEELFEIKPDDLLRMSKVVTERNELVHRRPYPRVIYLKSRWESLFGTLAGAAMEVAHYAQIKVLEEESDLIDNIQPSLKTAFVETTYTLLSLTLACEQLSCHTAIRVQCDKLQEYRNGYAHPRLDRFQRLLPQLTKLSLN